LLWEEGKDIASAEGGDEEEGELSELETVALSCPK
jgi:hypothetical protein